MSYAGNLGLDSGAPQSVYQLNTAAMRRLPIAPRPLVPGQSIKLPNGAGSVTFTGYRQWISVQVTYDPGRFPALVSAMVAVAGLLLSFLVRRRRLFVRVRQAGEKGEAGEALTEVEVGGLARSEDAEPEVAVPEVAVPEVAVPEVAVPEVAVPAHEPMTHDDRMW